MLAPGPATTTPKKAKKRPPPAPGPGSSAKKKHGKKGSSSAKKPKSAPSKKKKKKAKGKKAKGKGKAQPSAEPLANPSPMKSFEEGGWATTPKAMMPSGEIVRQAQPLRSAPPPDNVQVQGNVAALGASARGIYF